jgi:hypothetical protein
LRSKPSLRHHHPLVSVGWGIASMSMAPTQSKYRSRPVTHASGFMCIVAIHSNPGQVIGAHDLARCGSASFEQRCDLDPTCRRKRRCPTPTAAPPTRTAVALVTRTTLRIFGMQQIHQPTIAEEVDPGQGWVNVDIGRYHSRLKLEEPPTLARVQQMYEPVQDDKRANDERQQQPAPFSQGCGSPGP